MFRLTDKEIREATRSINTKMVNKIMDGTVYDKVYPEDRAITVTQLKKIADKIEDMANDGDSVGEVLKALREET